MRVFAVVVALLLAGCGGEPVSAVADAPPEPVPNDPAPAAAPPSLGLYTFSAFMGCELTQGEFQLAVLRGSRDEYSTARIEAAKRNRGRADEYRKAASGLAGFPDALDALKAARAAERMCHEDQSASAPGELKKALSRLESEMELISVAAPPPNE